METLTELQMEQLFTAYKNAGLMPMEANFEHFKQVTLDVLPPGLPDEKKDRKNKEDS